MGWWAERDASSCAQIVRSDWLRSVLVFPFTHPKFVILNAVKDPVLVFFKRGAIWVPYPSRFLERMGIGQSPTVLLPVIIFAPTKRPALLAQAFCPAKTSFLRDWRLLHRCQDARRLGLRCAPVNSNREKPRKVARSLTVEEHLIVRRVPDRDVGRTAGKRGVASAVAWANIP